MKEYKQEMVDFINNNNLNDIFVPYTWFYNNYKCNLYTYIRVSTEKQEFGRQLLELYEWAKKKNIKICIDYIFCDKYTGKTLKRDEYEQLRQNTKENDYILISEVSRLGRTWDDVKKEWYKLKSESINLLIMDYDMLSSPLPNEETIIMDVDKKFMQECIFNGILYASCKKIDEVSKTTKAGLKKAKLEGKQIGHPLSKYNTQANFIATIEYQLINNCGQYKATLNTNFPIGSYKKKLKECYIKYNTKDLKEILKKEREIK